MKNAYSVIEGWMELGNLEEADLEFQKLPPRALSTKRGLWLWLRLSRKLGRWAEVQAAAHELQTAMPAETLPILCEAEALHHQGYTTMAVVLLASRAARFTGEEWPVYFEHLKKYVALADLSPGQRAMFQVIVQTSEQDPSPASAANPAEPAIESTGPSFAAVKG